jgi:LuxR family transcriptional regulator, quorum-sensing system regulator CciR
VSLRDFIAETLKASTEQELFTLCRREAAKLGFDLASYHVVVEGLLPVPLDDGFFFNTFPVAWVRRYRERRYFDIDPIIAHARTAREPFHWYDVGSRMTLSPEQEAYMADLKACGMVDGVAIPVFSANGTVAYFGLGSSMQTVRMTAEDMLELQYACSQIHQRFMALHGEVLPEPKPLSPREREVLTWLTRGKSNSVIADILKVSDHTVDTLVRRVFAKLGVNDRINAALRGVGLGLVAH